MPSACDNGSSSPLSHIDINTTGCDWTTNHSTSQQNRYGLNAGVFRKTLIPSSAALGTATLLLSGTINS